MTFDEFVAKFRDPLRAWIVDVWAAQQYAPAFKDKLIGCQITKADELLKQMYAALCPQPVLKPQEPANANANRPASPQPPAANRLPVANGANGHAKN